MEKDDIFWYSMWKLVAACVCVLIASIAGCVSYSNTKIAEMVAAGEDPIVARCAIDGVNGSTASAAICAVKAAQK